MKDQNQETSNRPVEMINFTIISATESKSVARCYLSPLTVGTESDEDLVDTMNSKLSLIEKHFSKLVCRVTSCSG